MANIRELRKAKGLTQKQLAKLIDVTESQISQIETGKRNPGFETLLKLSEVFECTVDDIVRNKKIPDTVSDAEVLEDNTSTIKECNVVMRTLTQENQKFALDFLKKLASSQQIQDD